VVVEPGRLIEIFKGFPGFVFIAITG
jgi:hypothetical protein